MLDGATVATAFVEDDSYDVKMLSTARPVNDPSDLEALFVRTASGAMVPISTIVSLEERAVAPELGREEQQRAVAVTATLAPGVALGDALALGARRGGRGAARGRADRAAGRGRDPGGDLVGAADHLRLCDPRGAPGAGGAVRELRERRDRDGDGADGARLRGLRAAA